MIDRSIDMEQLEIIFPKFYSYKYKRMRDKLSEIICTYMTNSFKTGYPKLHGIVVGEK